MGSNHKGISRHAAGGRRMRHHLVVIVMMSIVVVVTNVKGTVAAAALHRSTTSPSTTTVGISTETAVANPYRQQQRKMQKLHATPSLGSRSSEAQKGDTRRRRVVVLAEEALSSLSHTSNNCLTKLRGGSSITSNVGGVVMSIVRFGMRYPILVLCKYLRKKCSL